MPAAGEFVDAGAAAEFAERGDEGVIEQAVNVTQLTCHRKHGRPLLSVEKPLALKQQKPAYFPSATQIRTQNTPRFFKSPL
jgi:hypothetical protein